MKKLLGVIALTSILFTGCTSGMQKQAQPSSTLVDSGDVVL